jgi:hypothetical protein
MFNGPVDCDGGENIEGRVKVGHGTKPSACGVATRETLLTRTAPRAFHSNLFLWFGNSTLSPPRE